jgi:hypothetical protein
MIIASYPPARGEEAAQRDDRGRAAAKSTVRISRVMLNLLVSQKSKRVKKSEEPRKNENQNDLKK